MKNVYLFLSALIVLTSTRTATAQEITSFTTDDGLIDNTVNCLVATVEDNKTVMWFGTQEGISKYDGDTWTNFNTTSHTGLIHNTISAIGVDDDGQIWVGTDFGLSFFDGTDWKSYTETDGLADNRVKYLKADGEGNLWIANNDGVSVFDGSTWKSYTKDDGLPFGGVSCIEIAENGDVWLGTGLGGVYIFDGTDFTAITEDDELLDDNITSIEIAPDNNRWIGTAKGITVLDASNKRVKDYTRLFVMPEPDTLNPVTDIEIDTDGSVWAGVYVDYLVTVGGVSNYANSTWTQLEESDGLAGPVVRGLAIDAESNVWIATSTGVSRTDKISSVRKTANQLTHTIYPNPAQETVNVVLKRNQLNSDFESVELYNLNMELISSKRINESQSELTFDVSELSKGMYFVKAGAQTTKLTVK